MNKIELLNVTNIGSSITLLKFVLYRKDLKEEINIKLKNDKITSVQKNEIEVLESEFPKYEKLVDIFSEL